MRSLSGRAEESVKQGQRPRHRGPGNVRELRNVLERATIVCEHDVIRVQDLSLWPVPLRIEDTTDLEVIERHAIERVMREVNGNKFTDRNQCDAPCARNSSRHALLKSRSGFIVSLSMTSGRSRNVLFGARYASMMVRTTRSALATTAVEEKTRILLTNA